MSIVTDEEYKRAKEYIEMIQAALNKSHERILELIDDLADARNMYETYKRAIRYNQELIDKYEAERKEK